MLSTSHQDTGRISHQAALDAVRAASGRSAIPTPAVRLSRAAELLSDVWTAAARRGVSRDSLSYVCDMAAICLDAVNFVDRRTHAR